MAGRKFDPQSDIPDLSGKVIFITGGTAGLGRSAIISLAQHNPSHIFFTGRNSYRAEELINELNSEIPTVTVTFIRCDHTYLASIKAAVDQFLTLSSRLDILICNAGIMALPPGTTIDGYELQFAVNHLSHAYLIKLLLPTLLSTAESASPPSAADVRIITVSSTAHRNAPAHGIDFTTLHTPQSHLSRQKPAQSPHLDQDAADPTQTQSETESQHQQQQPQPPQATSKLPHSPLALCSRWSRYAQSKLANLLYASQLALHHPSLTSVSIHPGALRTGIFTPVSLVARLPTLVAAAGVSRKRGSTISSSSSSSPVEKWTHNPLWAATCPKDHLVNGEFYEPVGRLGKRSRAASDAVLAERLWAWTERELGVYQRMVVKHGRIDSGVSGPREGSMDSQGKKAKEGEKGGMKGPKGAVEVVAKALAAAGPAVAVAPGPVPASA